MSITVKTVVKNWQFRQNNLDNLTFCHHLEVDFNILKAGIVFSKIS